MFLEANKKYVFGVVLSIYFVMLVRTAWIGDDAVITLRTVLNFIHGYGPNFNYEERVQAYTHPLWFVLLSIFTLLTQKVFYTAFVLSIIISLAAMALFLSRTAVSLAGALLAVSALILSKAYVDYSTSGLENPLSHLLILLAVLAAVRGEEGAVKTRLRNFLLCCSLLYLSRPDLILLLLPLAGLLAYPVRGDVKGLLRVALIGSIPALVWTFCAIYYYGFPFPNTAYAKLGTGIAFDERLAQGLKYILHSLGRDSLTPVFIALGVAMGLRSSSTANRALALGIALYLAYVLSIGGDFMAGRFLTAPLLVAAIIVARSKFAPGSLLPLGCGVFVLGLAGAQSTVLSGPAYVNQVIQPDGIADERGYYYPSTSLLSYRPEIYRYPAWDYKDKAVVVLGGGLGFGSVWGGPGVHAVDAYALSDPLLARLPARVNPNWRIGHFARQIPSGYIESVRTGENRLVDPKTRNYYESLRTITRGRLNSGKRWMEILRMNLGLVEKPDWDLYRSGVITEYIVHDQLPKYVPDGTPWGSHGNAVFSNRVEIALQAPVDITQLTISLDNNDVYEVWAYAQERWERVGVANRVSAGGMVKRVLKLERPALGVEKLKIIALEGDDLYSLGHLWINR
ncbi:arabinofuranosyltransferase [Burkholderiales bacterium]|nr:MAG: hypothetical protein F9K47_03125 [Burkholderiales bacterium]CAG0997550.1 arabinofuranosyltransferase [Burkholderiales bacterium]